MFFLCVIIGFSGNIVLRNSSCSMSGQYVSIISLTSLQIGLNLMGRTSGFFLFGVVQDLKRVAVNDFGEFTGFVTSFNE